MSHEKINQARVRYKKGEIQFMKLNDIFFQYATNSEKEEFWNSPTFDRPSVVEGKSKIQIDSEWNSLVKNW